MPLPGREELAKGFLDGAERHFEAQVTSLTSDIDNLLGNSVGIDDHARLDNALQQLFETLSAAQDALETVRNYRKERGL
jgi:hypothetical protein